MFSRVIKLSGLLMVMAVSPWAMAQEVDGFGLGQSIYSGSLDLTPPNDSANAQAPAQQNRYLPDLFAPKNERGTEFNGKLMTRDNDELSFDHKSIEGAELQISIPN